ncbi:MAG: SPASM domain-containing protein, partial [Tenericutes bacterium]|nr:SPASM domain-containing protein [Mycoplasmatota bacterium]
VKGEPLLHPKLKEILDLCEKYHKKVNITTNATLLKAKETILSHPAIRQINLSVHSENQEKNYLEEIFEVTDKLKEKNIVYRFWTMNDNNLNKKSTELVEKIINHYKLSPEIVEKIKTDNNIKINSNTYVNKANQFVWPNINNDYYNDKGYCYALKDQVAILVDGTIVPCCLDSDGVINLGNIYQNDLLQVINSSRYQKMRMGFCNRKVTEELCKHCSYKERFDIN